MVGRRCNLGNDDVLTFLIFNIIAYISIEFLLPMLNAYLA